MSPTQPPRTSSLAPTGRADGTVALVPLRSPGVGKSRLASTLSPDERGALAGAMLADVVAALGGAQVDRVVVAAAGPAAAAAASAVGAEVLHDPAAIGSLPPGRRLDAAIAAATATLSHASALLVVAGDLPHLRAADIDAVLAQEAEVVVAPTRDGGTGGLLRRPPAVSPTSYGRGSADRHLRLARTAGVRAVRCERAGFAHDVDLGGDLGRSRHDRSLPPLGARTAALLADTGFGATG